MVVFLKHTGQLPVSSLISHPELRLNRVSLRYGDTLALDNLNLEIPANRIVGLIGLDGVGKSSLMSLLTGARKLQTGNIEWRYGFLMCHIKVTSYS